MRVLERKDSAAALRHPDATYRSFWLRAVIAVTLQPEALC
jgi:hypothetical protein